MVMSSLTVLGIKCGEWLSRWMKALFCMKIRMAFAATCSGVHAEHIACYVALFNISFDVLGRGAPNGFSG